MEREQFDRKGGDALDGLGHSVGDVVQLQIEKYLVASVGDFTHEVRAVGGEELEPNFDPFERIAEAVEHGEGFFTGLHVECEDELARCLIRHEGRLGSDLCLWQSAKVEIFMAEGTKSSFTGDLDDFAVPRFPC